MNLRFGAGLGYLVAAAALGAVVGLRAQSPQAGSPEAASHSAPMLERYGKPYVMVTINGRGPYRFIIDTGTGADVLITPELAGELGLSPVAESTLSDPTGQGRQKVPVIELNSIELAGVEFNNVDAIEHTIISEAGETQGLLGFPLFRDYLLTLDFPNRRVSLSTGSLTADGEQAVLPFRLGAEVPVVMITVGGESVEAQLDSGGVGLEFPEGLGGRLRYEVDPGPFAVGRSISTCFEIKGGKLDSDVHVGRYTFTHPMVQIHPAFPLTNFGSWAMQMFAITFDQENDLVRFEADQNRFTLTAPATPSGLTNAPHEPPPPGLVPVG